MRLSKENISRIGNEQVQTLPPNYFELPEKVLQFGTGVLLRGLPDYYIDKANKQNVFNGRIVVVKSTESKGADVFAQQDGLYTHCMSGIENGKSIERKFINASISRVLSATEEWGAVLDCACNPDLQIVISNTTEVGITLVEDYITSVPPVSFPGKLLAFLYKRFKYFEGDASKGLVVIPTELIPDNGAALKAILLKLAEQNELEPSFLKWIETCNEFCNSLVDRIVPGKPTADQQLIIEEQVGYKDDLVITSELYGLWAIETKNDRVKDILSFHSADEGVVIAPDINVFRELKLRLLNGSHTFTCGLAHLAGFKTVREAMENEVFSEFITNLMIEEIAPTITGKQLRYEQAVDFAKKVLDRYRNPFIEHKWLSITLQYTSKMVMRNLPTFKRYYERMGSIPEYMAVGFAAWLLFMKCEEGKDNKYCGSSRGESYQVNDDLANTLAAKWRNNSIDNLAESVLGDKMLWHEDLTVYPGLVDLVSANLVRLMNEGAETLMYSVVSKRFKLF